MSNTLEQLRERMAAAGLAAMAVELPDALLSAVMNASRTHKDQPLARLIRAVTDEAISNPSAASAAYNSENGVRAGLAAQERAQRSALPGDGTTMDYPLAAWLRKRLQDSCAVKDYANAAAALGEIRALGALIGAEVSPLGEGNEPRPEFLVHARGVDFIVEVKTRQMDSTEAKHLAAFDSMAEPTGGGDDRAAGRARSRKVVPFGRPQLAGEKAPTKSAEVAASNVAQRISQYGQKVGQARPGIPSLLWLDLQDEDVWFLGRAHCAPVSVRGRAFHTPGVWHGYFGEPGLPFFDGERLQDGQPCRAWMQHHGRFGQTRAWAAVVLAFSNGIVVFQHPDAETPMPAALVDYVIGLPGFDFERSVLGFPLGRASVAESINRTKLVLRALAERGSASRQAG